MRASSSAQHGQAPSSQHRDHGARRSRRARRLVAGRAWAAGGGGPFEQAAAAHRDAPDGAHDGVEPAAAPAAAAATNCQQRRPGARSRSVEPTGDRSGRSARSSRRRHAGRPARPSAARPRRPRRPAPAPPTASGTRVGEDHAASSASDAGATSERRRLSTIFQRLMARDRGSAAGCSRSGSSCQSPRVQRCTREAATSAWNGCVLDHRDVGHRGAARERAFEQVVAQHLARAAGGRRAPHAPPARRAGPCR